MKRKLLILFMMFLTLIGGGKLNELYAQTVVTIGEMPDYNDAGGSYSLADNWFGYAFSQQIYTAEEIANAGGFEGTIKKIAFKKYYGGSVERIWSIYLKEIDETEFTSNYNYIVSDEDLQYNGSFNTGGEWVSFDISGFQYSGGNLLVTVLDNANNYTSDVNWSQHSVANKTITGCTSSQINLSTQKTWTSYPSARFHIQLTFAAAGSDEPTDPDPEPGESAKQYRIKDTNTGKYLNIEQITNQNTGGKSGVNVADKSESDRQIFTIEETGSGTYYFRSADGYYISCLDGWMVSAYYTETSNATALTLVDQGNGNFYIQNPDGYFKVEYVGTAGGYYPFSNGTSSEVATWTLEEVTPASNLEFEVEATATEVCDNYSEGITLSVNMIEGEANSYAWTGEGINATDINNETVSISVPDIDEASKTYTYSCTINGETTESVEITVYDMPEEFTIDNQNITINSAQTATFTIIYTGNMPSPDNYNVINNTVNEDGTMVVTTKKLYEDTEITYKVSNWNSPWVDASSSYLCSVEKTVNITVNPTFYVTLEANTENVCDNGSVILTATPHNTEANCTYAWSVVEGSGTFSEATSQTTTFTPAGIENVASQTMKLQCIAYDGTETMTETIDVYVYDVPELNLDKTTYYVTSGETVTIDVKCPKEYCNLDYDSYYDSNDNFNPVYTTTDDGIQLTYVVEEDRDIELSLYNWGYYDASISGYPCASTANVSLKVINENKETEIGSNESSSNLHYLPVRTDKQYSLTQQIYKASELNINEASEITSVSFYTTELYAQNARNIEVYMANTDLNAFNGNGTQSDYASELADDFVNMTETANFSGEVTFNEGWTTITFTTPFTYEVGKNVILTVNDKTGFTDNLNEYGCYLTTGEIRSIAMYSSSTIYDPANITTDGSYTLAGNLEQNNHVKFGYQAIAQDELVAKINVDAEEICDGDNSNKFEMFATRVENATYDWYLVVDEVDNLLEENVREYTYSNEYPGTYKIKLVVTQNSVSKEDEIDLTINPTPKTDVVLGTNGYGFVGEELTYVVNNHIVGTKYAIELVVDDVPYPANSNPTDETDIGSHVFDNDGTFYYTVDADREGCTAEKTHRVVIYPKATFDVSNLCAGQEVEFTNTTYTPNGGWNFGEGEGFVWNFNGTVVASNDATVTHTFAARTEPYTVTLTVTKSGVSNVATQSVYINPSPVVELSWDKTTIYEDITFTATSDDAESYIWEIDGNVQENENEATFTYQFQSLNDHKVAVTAVSATGCSTRREETITITEKLSEPKVMVNNVEVSSIDMGFRPYGAWMRPIEILITPDGTTDLTINSITIEDKDDEGPINFIYMTDEVNNATIEPENTLSVLLTHDKYNEVIADIKPGNSGFSNTATMTINYGENQTKVINIKYNAYEPNVPDVWEKAKEITVGTTTPTTVSRMRSNYLLEGATSAHGDAVFKMTIEEDKAADIDVTVTGTNPLVYVYPEDFGGEGGPGLTNYVGYGEQSTGIFFGFEFNFEDATGLSLIDKGGNNNFVVDIHDQEKPYYLRSSKTYGGGTEDNYCWTLDKYYVSEEAKLSYDINVEDAGQYYEILLSENEDYSDAVVLKSATQEVNANFETVTLDLSEYAGGKYYFGIRHYSDVDGMIKFDNYRLYEDARATREGTTFNFMLGAGTYYIVAASQVENASSFDVTITSENLEAPENAVAVLPQDKTPGIATTIGQLKWNFGANTEKYQVLFGTTNPPTETMIEWTNYLEANPSCPLKPLATNTVYYWRVDAQNPAGTTEGDVWRFATDFDAPQNLVLSKEVIDLGQTSELSWTGVDFGDGVDGYYNILVDGEKWGESVPKTTTTFVLSGLPYKNEPYKIIVEAVYPIDSWDVTAKSESVALKVNTYSMGVKGYVYDDYTKEPIQGAKVTYGTTSATTNESGYYSIGTLFAGSYIASASCTGYFRNEVTVNVPTDKVLEQNFYLKSAKTMPEVVATERNEDVVDVEWTLNSTSEPMYEDFENEAFKYNWKTSAYYPWKVVANGFVDDVDDDDDEYDFFGGFCVKSTNSDYDYDLETGGNEDDKDYQYKNTTSFLELEVYVPYSTTMRFYYRISSTSIENYLSDYGRFLVNGVQVGEIYSGDGSWSRSGYTEYTVEGGKTYKFRWEYVKGDAKYYFEDAFFIDNISFYENANLYNVYVKDILSDDEPTPLATEITAEEYEYTGWATETDGIYQWGVSAIYNDAEKDLLNEDFDVLKGEMYRINIGESYDIYAPVYSVNDFVVIKHEYEITGYDANVYQNVYTHYYYVFDRDANEEPLNNGWTHPWTQTEGSNWFTSACADPYLNQDFWAKDFSEDTPTTSMFGMNNGDSNGHYYLVSPKIDASLQSYLVFDYIVPQWDDDSPQYFNKFRVVYGETPEGPWTALTEYNEGPVNEWTTTPKPIELPLIENCYIAFENYDYEAGLGVGLDNVRVYSEERKGASNIAWSNLIGKGNKLVTEDGDWSSLTSWSRDHIPTVDEVAIIKAAGTVNGAGAVAKAVLVDNGTLKIGEGGVLTASTVIDSVAADITINAGGQLVHSNEGVMATFVKGIQAYTDDNNGWYTISSPLAADINASDVDYLLDGEFDLYRYDEPTHYWENYEDAEDAEGPNNTDWDNNSAVIEKGRGYLYANSADKQLSFAGELNVAEVTTSLSAQAQKLIGFNLLGNPFAHDIYQGVAFDKDGNLAEAHYTLNNHGAWQATTKENPIKSGAGFLVQATEGANLTISKTNAQTRAAANSMLAVTVVNNVFEDVAYVSFNDGIGLEKIGHMNEYAPMVYIPGDFNNYAYATVEEDVTEVPVNFEAMTMGEYTIAVKAKNCEYETMILVDNLTGKETNLLKDSYTFMATTTDDPDRFVIKLAKDAEVEDSFIYINNGELIFDNLSNDAIINVFDVLGRNIATFNNCGDTTFRVSTDLFADGVYMVRVIEGNNVKVQKMVIE